MARYRGPKSKIARKFREPIFGEDKVLAKKKYGPGMHGPNKRKGTTSEYGKQLSEKQKAKYTYGILERQFRNLYKKANAHKGVTGEVLLQLCECRLDNVVYRMGIAKTRDAARQLVSHKHILLNDRLCNIPSTHINDGDIITIREKSKSLVVVSNSLANRISYDWIEWDNNLFSGKFMKTPERQQIPENINEQLIVELYSK